MRGKRSLSSRSQRSPERRRRGRRRTTERAERSLGEFARSQVETGREEAKEIAMLSSSSTPSLLRSTAEPDFLPLCTFIGAGKRSARLLLSRRRTTSRRIVQRRSWTRTRVSQLPPSPWSRIVPFQRAMLNQTTFRLCACSSSTSPEPKDRRDRQGAQEQKEEVEEGRRGRKSPFHCFCPLLFGFVVL